MLALLNPCSQRLTWEPSDSREIAEAAAPGSGIVASTILALGLAWSNVEAPEAQASFELPYSVSRSSLEKGLCRPCAKGCASELYFCTLPGLA